MTKLRPFRFAFLVADARQRTGEDWEALAGRAEALGHDTFGVSDQFEPAAARVPIRAR